MGGHMPNSTASLLQVREKLSGIIAEYDGHAQAREAASLREEFAAALPVNHPKRSQILQHLGKDPVLARTLVDELLQEAA